jgi:hypothetical protein
VYVNSDYEKMHGDNRINYQWCLLAMIYLFVCQGLVVLSCFVLVVGINMYYSKKENLINIADFFKMD